MEMAARKLAAPPDDLAKTLRSLPRTEEFQELRSAVG